MRRFAVFTFVLVLLVALIGGLSYFQFVFKPQMIRGFISKAAPPPATVAATTARQDRWTTELPAIGTFRAVAGIDVAPQVAGIVTSVNVKSGDDVAKGQVLVTLDDSTDQADLASALAAERNAALAYQRQVLLVRGGNTAKAQVDQALATRDQAAAQVAKERALIAQKRIVAPFSGRLGLRSVEVGQYVSPGASLVTLQQLDPIQVDFPVPEQSFDLLKVGEPVHVTVDAYKNRIFTGRIASIDARVSAASRNVTVRAEFPNPDKALLPGMFANVTVLAGAPKPVVTLPTTAVTYSLYGDSVYVLAPAPGEPGSAQAAAPSDRLYLAKATPVRVGDTRQDRVAILEGVKAGEQVISEGQIKLIPGAPVKINDADALPSRLTPRPKE